MIFRWITTVAEIIIVGASINFLIIDENSKDLKNNLRNYLIAFSICGGISFLICLFLDIIKYR
jgi:hypothetical protein